ncbi:histone deacetylase [Neurospora sp. IMI 360204]|nr:histone deacetylase [Neurospora sp. IMI 360204]
MASSSSATFHNRPSSSASVASSRSSTTNPRRASGVPAGAGSDAHTTPTTASTLQQRRLSRTASKGQLNKNNADGDLTQSLNHLSIATASPSSGTSQSPSPRKSPRSANQPPAAISPLHPQFSSSTAVSPNGTPSRPGSAMRNVSSGGPPSRSQTPALRRKASMNSINNSHGHGSLLQRRSSSVNLTPSAAKKSPLNDMSPETSEFKAPPTPQSIASDHFKAELEIHHGDEPRLSAETIVILNDACYGHRYSRPRTSKANLSTIVERPERIKASVLGVSAAYVRLGERHQDGSFPIHPDQDPRNLPSVPFLIQKTTRRLPITSPTVTNVHGTKWMEELKIMCDTAEAKLATNGKELQRPDMDRGPNAEEPPKFHEGDLYLGAESLEAMEGALGGVCEAVDAVFRPEGPKRAFVAIRPPGHHCSASYPSGFCWVNNVHVGIMHAILSHGLTHAAIIDFDLHHGDGSQQIAWQHNSRGVKAAKNAAMWKKTSIGYFSLHDINSYPCETGDDEKVMNASICIDNAHGQNVWNVHLQPWKTEDDFWALYESKYTILLEKARSYLVAQAERLRAAGQNAKAAIFLSAGFDASEWEGAGMQRHQVNVPTDFYARLTRDVVRIAAEVGTAVEGRIISVLEGGYSDRALCSGIMSHVCGLAGVSASGNGQVHDQYNPSWWSASELERLETTLLTPPPEPPKPPRNVAPPTYCSPTQASTARSVAPRRSMSGLHQHALMAANRPLSPIPSRIPMAPAPEVPWAIAACELSKLLIPRDRQTDSCTHTDLNAEATKARRERQLAQANNTSASDAGTANSSDRPSTRMALRDRKAKQAMPIKEEDTDDDRMNAVSAGETGMPRGGARAARSRRLSAASTIVPDSLDASPPSHRYSAMNAGDDGRPETSMSIRPESSMSVRAQGNPLVVMKARGPAKNKYALQAPRTQRKTSTSTIESARSSNASLVSPASASHSAGAQPSNGSNGDGVDNLTGGMKKVKITLITQAQKEARERERVAKENLAANEEAISVVTSNLDENKPHQQQPTQTPVATVQSPTESNTSTQFYTPNSQGRNSISSSEDMDATERYPELFGHHHQDVDGDGDIDMEDLETPALTSTPMPGRTSFPLPSRPFQPARNPSISHQEQQQHQHQQPFTPMENFIQYQPPAAKPTAHHAQTPTSPGPAMNRTDVPVFTATSAIPFSPQKTEQLQQSPAPSTPASLPSVIFSGQKEGVVETPERN